MKLRILALLLAVSLLLGGCGMVDFGGYFSALGSAVTGSTGVVPFESMEYVRPDMAELEQTYEALCEAARGEDVEAIVDAIYTFYDAYDWFYTCYSLADIHYSADLRDSYWEKEYNYCVENSAQADALLEDMNYVLAKSPCREKLEGEEYFGAGYFDGYEGENLWDDAFSELLTREGELMNEYYVLSEEALAWEPGTEAYYDACADGMAELLVELIEVRQEMAAYWGYGSYTEFANDFYYYRDYAPEEADAYLDGIREELVDVYTRMNSSGIWEESAAYCSEEENLAFLKQAAKNMGGTIWEAFQMMEAGNLYDISYGENKYPSSFEVYLTSYYQPFVFLYPQQTQYDKLAFAHEFGHFCNDYACYGSYAGVDVLEFYSLGMEYLAVCYGEDTQMLSRLKLADSLALFVEQAAFASFEQQMYGLTGEDLSVEGLYALYEDVALAYGFDSVGYDRREFVDITHFYTNPMYIISYVVSNDAAMQLYQMEQRESGAGLALMEEVLDSQESWFLAFLEEAGLESPFAAGRLQEVRQTFETVFG